MKTIDEQLAPFREAIETRCAQYGFPMGLIVGWLSVESDFDPGETTALHEYGLFQVMPSESKDLGFDHDRIRTDPEYGLDCGFHLVAYYVQIARRLVAENGFSAYALPGSEYLYRVAKLAHSMGIGATRLCLDAATGAGMIQSWDVLAGYLCSHDMALSVAIKLKYGHHESPAHWVELVDRVFSVGAPFGVEGLTCQSVA